MWSTGSRSSKSRVNQPTDLALPIGAQVAITGERASEGAR